jgi:hypothetical protein
MRSYLTTKTLHNTGIERAERHFRVSCILFGSTAREADFDVLAATPRGAIRIARSFYPRSSQHSARAVAPAG